MASTQAQVLDGKALAAEIRRQVAAEVERRKTEDPSFKPALTILQVGGREDSNVYIRMKSKAAREVSASKNNNVFHAVHFFAFLSFCKEEREHKQRK